MNLSVYKLKNISELDAFINLNPSRFGNFDARVHQMLDNLPEGSTIDVQGSIEEKSYEIFVKLVCAYIDEKRYLLKEGDSYIEFMDAEYNYIRRTESYLPHRHKAIIPQFITT